jgi:hypothetical protein
MRKKKRSKSGPPLWDSSVHMHRSPTAAGAETDKATVDSHILEIFAQTKKRKGCGWASKRLFAHEVSKFGIGDKEAKVN